MMKETNLINITITSINIHWNLFELCVYAMYVCVYTHIWSSFLFVSDSDQPTLSYRTRRCVHNHTVEWQSYYGRCSLLKYTFMIQRNFISIEHPFQIRVRWEAFSLIFYCSFLNTENQLGFLWQEVTFHQIGFQSSGQHLPICFFYKVYTFLRKTWKKLYQRSEESDGKMKLLSVTPQSFF